MGLKEFRFRDLLGQGLMQTYDHVETKLKEYALDNQDVKNNIGSCDN